MKKEIKFSLVYRDMWQSSGKYQPRVDQLVRVAPLIIDMGCFARVETNGGAFEQVNLLYGENPNRAVRAFTRPFHEAGIQTHMLDRGLNALRMYPVPADVRRLMYRVKHAQGVDITRIFCGLNETRNIIPSIKYALEAGMIPQATLCITYSPVHTVDYYAGIADQLIAAGAPEICLKDMAGIGRPAMLGRLVKRIKEKHPDVLIQYHGHSGPGLSMASILEVCENGADIIDVAMEPMSWGKVHPDVISVQAMLRDAGVRNISVDVIFGGLGVSLQVLDDTVSELLALGPDHVSAYQLGIEEGSELGRMLREGRYTETPDDECREQYDLLCSRLASAGFEHYEISNWARPGRRAVHNSAYWKRLPYVGLGPAAHSFDGSRRSWNSCALSGWTREYEDITPEQAREEAVMLGLRTSDGIDPSLCDSATVERLLSEGLLCRCGDSACCQDRIRIPEPEFFVSDSIIEALA